jgi:TldD protein
MKEMNRRDFLKLIGAGTAFVSLPLVNACRTKKGLVTPKEGGGQGGEVGAHTTYFDRFGVDRQMIERILREGLGRGGGFADVFLQHKVSHWVQLEDGEVNRAYTKVDLGAGIRVLKGDATGFAYCEDLTEDALVAAARTAATVASGPAVARPKPLGAVEVKSQYPVPVPWTEVGIEKKVPLLQAADGIARKRDSRMIKVSVYFNDETSHILVADSEGRLVEDDHPMVTFSVSCVGQHEGETETGYESAASADGLRFLTKERVRDVAERAVDHTAVLFGAESPPAGSMPVVLAPGLTGILLHEAIGHGMEADFNRKGISIYADRIGKRIAPKGVNIYDDGTNPRMRGSINVDDEGTVGQKTLLVEDGVLRSYMHDRISANHYGVERTGSGRRQSFRYPPVPRMRNTYMASGSRKPEEIIRSVKRGIYAERFQNGQVHIGAGDFTFYLKHGRLIEDGKLTKVIKDANLIGSGPKVLDKVDMVGDDLKMFSGAGYCGKDGQRVPVGFGMPTVRAGGISVGGRKS